MIKSLRPLTGRMLQIVSGKSELALDVVQKYRQMAILKGHTLPELEVNKALVRGSTRQALSLVGTVLSESLRWIEKIKPENATCACKSLAKEMNNDGVAKCRERWDEYYLPKMMANKEAITAALKKESNWLWTIGVVGDLIPDWVMGRWLRRQFDQAAEKVAEPVAVRPVRIRKPLSRHVKVRNPKSSRMGLQPSDNVKTLQFGNRQTLRWAVGMTVANRAASAWQASRASMTVAGWDVTTFCEPGIPGDVVRPNTAATSVATDYGKHGLFGAFQNYHQTLCDLLQMHPDAEWILYAQDDAFFPPGAKEFLERLIWPKDCALLSLWCPSGFRYPAIKAGAAPPASKPIVGAVAYMMPRETAEMLVKSPTFKTWGGSSGNQKGHQRRTLDFATGQALQAAGCHALVLTRSLVDHWEPRANNSSIGNGAVTGFRMSYQFVGRESTADQIIEQFQPDQQPVLVVIPGHGLAAKTIRCVAAIRRSTVPTKIVYVDNGSSDRVNLLISISLSGHPHAHLRNETNEGFTAAVQRGLDVRAAGQHVLILNNDCYVEPETIDALLSVVTSGDRVAAACPVTDDRGVCGLHDVRNQKIRQERTVRTAAVLPWACCLLHGTALNEVSHLPTDAAAASGLGVDDWWCKQVQRLGWDLRVTGATLVEHEHSATFAALGIDRKAEQVRAQKWLRKS